MSWFILVCYILFMYGISVIFTTGIGPAAIFLRIRKWAEGVGPTMKLMFSCMLCFPTWFAFLFSMLNWFFIPIAITPFNMVFSGMGFWWFPLVALMDAAATGGICRFIWNIDDYVDKSTPIYEDEVV